MIFAFFYEMALLTIAFFSLPKLLYSALFYKKYRQSFLRRFGFYFPIKKPLEKSSIWIHAVSVGETKAIATVARELKRRFPDQPLIVSSTTETGHAEAKRSLPFADYHVYLPFDFALVVHRIIKKTCPKLVILSESDIWYNFLSFAKEGGAAIVLASGKMSEKSMRRYRLISFFSQRLFALFDLFCLQNTLYRGRFIEAGCDPQKMVVTGNLKLDEVYPQLTLQEVADWREKLGIGMGDLVLTIGSTHSPEEKLMIDVFKRLKIRFPFVRMIVVPRHPDRFKEVAHLLDKSELKWIAFSDIQNRTGGESVILMDAMGLLRMCYQLSDMAIVGGSFTDRVGGHNILEPCWYEKPVIFGPHMHTQVEFVDLIQQYGAGVQVSQEEVQGVVENWIENPKIRKEIGSKGMQLIGDLRGSTKRTLAALEPLLDFSKNASEAHPARPF